MYKTKSIAIASGKGGVGKSTLTLNLSCLLSYQYNMLAIDCDLGLANLDVLLGKSPEYTLQDIFCDSIEPYEACIDITPTFKLLPSASGTIESIGMDTMAVHLLFSKLSSFLGKFDGVIFDLGASITPVTLSFIEHASHVVIIVTPEPTSTIDSYALIKVLANKAITDTVYIICSMVEDENQAAELFTRLQENIHKSIPTIQLCYIGYIEYTPDVPSAVYNQQLVVESLPESIYTKNMKEIVHSIDENIFA